MRDLCTALAAAVKGAKPTSVTELNLDQKFRADNLTGLEPYVNLASLSLSAVGLTSLEGLPTSAALRTLVVSDNKISGGLDVLATCCPNLRRLDLTNNRMASVSVLQPLSALSVLQSLEVEANPLASVPNYRQAIFKLIPSLGVIDQQDIHGKEALNDEEEDGDEEEEEYDEEEEEEQEVEEEGAEEGEEVDDGEEGQGEDGDAYEDDEGGEEEGGDEEDGYDDAEGEEGEEVDDEEEEEDEDEEPGVAALVGPPLEDDGDEYEGEEEEPPSEDIDEGDEDEEDEAGPSSRRGTKRKADVDPEDEEEEDEDEDE